MSELSTFSRLRQTLSEVFGITRLRPGQEEVIHPVMEGRNTPAVMPTGAGKSLCYQLPALHLLGTTIVVSSLIALMQDQVDKLAGAGLDASQVNSALSEWETAGVTPLKKEQDGPRVREGALFATPHNGEGRIVAVEFPSRPSG